MAESKDGGFFMSKRNVGDHKDRMGSRSNGDDYDSKSSKHSEPDMDEEDVLSDDAKPPRRASVGWGASDSGGATADDKQADGGASAANVTTAETKRAGRRRKGGDSAGGGGSDGKGPKNRHFDDDRESTEIVEIPDLEEEEREPDLITQVAEAPRNTTRAVQSLKELDRDIKFSLPSSAAMGVDLSLLTSVLCPERAVIESDEHWNFDSLLNDVSQEMQKDLDEKEEMLKAESAP